jgi:hypothetical protein
VGKGRIMQDVAHRPHRRLPGDRRVLAFPLRLINRAAPGERCPSPRHPVQHRDSEDPRNFHRSTPNSIGQAWPVARLNTFSRKPDQGKVFAIFRELLTTFRVGQTLSASTDLNPCRSRSPAARPGPPVVDRTTGHPRRVVRRRRVAALTLATDSPAGSYRAARPSAGVHEEEART